MSFENPSHTMGFLKDSIQQALEPLVGLPLWSAGRAVNLIWLQFGQKRRVKETFGDQKTKTVGAYSLHLQTHWRIVRDARILVGRQDMYFPADTKLESKSFDWKQPRTTRCDQTLQRLLRRNHSPWVVRTVRGNDLGDIGIEFENGAILETFTPGAVTGELWRLFQAYKDLPHFVVSLDGAGGPYIETEE
jgi:hypothetical protein